MQAERVPRFADLELPDFPHAVVVTGVDGVRMCHGDWKEPFPWASVTKLLAVYATLIAVEHRLVDLDSPAGPPGATVRHLMAHTAGYDFDSGQVLTRPGTTRLYSNHGIEVLGEHVAEATGVEMNEWIEQTVLVPLSLATVLIEGSPAWGAHGTAEDLATFGRELLAPTLLPAEALDDATTVAFGGLKGVAPGFGRQDPSDWGLGFDLKAHKSPHWTGHDNSPGTFGHFGRDGSFLWVDPAAGLATAFLGARRYGPWAAHLWPRLADAVLEDCAR